MARVLPAELARHLASLLRRSRRRYRQRLESCQLEFSETAVHQLRVETRRALALLDLLAALNPGDIPKKARRTLKRRLNAFDELRDTQVQLHLLEPWLEQFPEACAFATYLRDSEDNLVADLRKEVRTLGPRRIEHILKSLERDVKDARGNTTRPPLAYLQKPLRIAFARVANLRRQVRRLDPATIHRTRVAFKQFRYLCELLQPLMPDATPQRLRAMRDWQTRMGDIQDLEVVLHTMERAVRHGKISIPSVKRLHAKLARHLVLLVNRFIDTADRLDQFGPQPTDREVHPK